jgi:hypothetical protein
VACLVFRGIRGLAEALGDGLATVFVGFAGGVNGLTVFGADLVGGVVFLATGFTTGWTLATGLDFGADLLVTAVFVLTAGLGWMAGFVVGLALTTGLVTDFTTGFLLATGLDAFTVALPAVGLGTDLAATLLTGLALAATVLALVDTDAFTVLGFNLVSSRHAANDSPQRLLLYP